MAWSECCASLIHPLPHLDRKKGETQIKSKLTKTQYTWGWKHGITYLRLSFSLETPPLRLNHNSQSHRRFLHLVHGKISQDTYPKRKKLTRIQWPFVIGRLWYYLTKEIFGSKRKWVSLGDQAITWGNRYYLNILQSTEQYSTSLLYSLKQAFFLDHFYDFFQEQKLTLITHPRVKDSHWLTNNKNISKGNWTWTFKCEVVYLN